MKMNSTICKLDSVGRNEIFNGSFPLSLTETIIQWEGPFYLRSAEFSIRQILASLPLPAKRVGKN
jgi:hypothetical protein